MWTGLGPAMVTHVQWWWHLMELSSSNTNFMEFMPHVHLPYGAVYDYLVSDFTAYTNLAAGIALLSLMATIYHELCPLCMYSATDNMSHGGVPHCAYLRAVY